MICACGTETKGALLCPACGAIQAVGADPDRFAVLGVERRYDVAPAALEARYRELSRKLHPDRFARADRTTRVKSLLAATALNDAYRLLRKDVPRAEHLLALEGVRIDEKEPAPPELLAEVLEWREALAEGGDAARLGAEMRARRARVLAGVAAGFAARELAAVKAGLVELRYIDRFLVEVAARTDREAEHDRGPNHSCEAAVGPKEVPKRSEHEPEGRKT
jgi:molecular chaperone HscB